MKRSALRLGCLLAIIVLAGFTPRHSEKASSQKTIRMKSFSCPTASDFHLETVDLGWSGGGCSYMRTIEVYLVYHGSSFTEPVQIEFEGTYESATGTSSYTYWQTIHPGNPRTYIGNNWESWNDMNCNGVKEFDEVEYHSLAKTGQSHC